MDAEDPQGSLASMGEPEPDTGGSGPDFDGPVEAGRSGRPMRDDGSGRVPGQHGDSSLPPTAPPLVPRGFMDLCEHVLCHTDPDRYGPLYRVLWRLAVGGERGLLRDAADEDVHRLGGLAKAVRRDAHKMKAFVRFQRVDGGAGAGPARFVAWHRPDHRVLPLVAPFFARRFAVMSWSILTPHGSAHWDGVALTHGPAAPRRDAPTGDALEDFWRTYYASVFNPARTNLRAMRREMPERYWATLPEASLITPLAHGAAGRVGKMIGTGPAVAAGPMGAAAYLPADRRASLPVLREAAAGCRGCGICEGATRTVFGEGPADARLMLVGEQPGDQEDLAGRPFVGPAGEVLDRALAEAGIERGGVYLTNAVKHFKWTPSPHGNRRVHGKPSLSEARACRPWLEQEIGAVRPAVIVLLGSTAGQSLLGAGFRIGREAGHVLTGTPWAGAVVATYHPSAVLRAPTPGAQREHYAAIVGGLRTAGRLAFGGAGAQSSGSV